MRMRTIGAAVAVAALVLVGCGDSDSNGSSSGNSADEATQEAIDLMNQGDMEDMTGKSEVTVEAVDNNFKPQYIEISKGTSVKFVNEGRNVHNVLPVQDGDFKPIDADEFDPGDDETITFDEVGDFPYYCSLHGSKTKGMIGGIRVVE